LEGRRVRTIGRLDGVIQPEKDCKQANPGQKPEDTTEDGNLNFVPGVRRGGNNGAFQTENSGGAVYSPNTGHGVVSYPVGRLRFPGFWDFHGSLFLDDVVLAKLEIAVTFERVRSVQRQNVIVWPEVKQIGADADLMGRVGVGDDIPGDIDTSGGNEKDQNNHNKWSHMSKLL